MQSSRIRPSSPSPTQNLGAWVRSQRLMCVLALGFALLSPISRAQKAIRVPQKPVSEVVPGEILIGVHASQDDAKEAARLNTTVGTVIGRQADLHAYRMRLRPGLTIAAAIARLRLRGDVAYAEPNHIYHVNSIPNDTYYANQYAPHTVQAEQAWDIWNPVSPVILAIVDTGIDGTHPDLTNKMYRDGSGNILGYNSVTGQTGAAADDFGHGTHCAGIAAAQINNGVGIAGIAGWNGNASTTDTTYTKLMPVKVLDSNGNGTDVTVADGITWAANNGAQVISMSLGGPDTSSTLNAAVQYAWNKGCVIVAAAGNNGANTFSYPAACANVISVAATDSTDTLANFSNYGSWVSVAAPGVNIFSTVPTYQTNGGFGTNYNYLSGTSMATPHVAGEAALILAQNPTLTNSQVSALITSNVDPYTPYYANGSIVPGGGRINVYKALLAAGGGIGLPGAPSNLVATGGNTTANLTWNAPLSATSYNIKRSLVSGGPYTNIATGVTATTYVDTGLTNGTTYYYVVSAVDALGEGPNSNEGVAIPNALITVYQIHAGPGTIGSFNPDNYYTGGSLYTVTQNIDTSAANAAPMAVYQTQRFGNFSYVMPNLAPGAPYTVRLHFAESYFSIPGQRYFNVSINGATVLSNFDIATAAGAVNKAIVEQFNTTADSGGNITITFLWQTNWPLVNGVEILASASNTAPSAPTNVKATAGNAQVGLSWSASYGATSYNIYRSTTSGSGFAVVGASTTTSYTDTSVTNGTTYYYVVTAVNTSGESAPSTPVSATPTAVTAVYQIHAGPGTIGSFTPDNYYIGGSLYTVTQNIDTSAANAAPMAVYQTQRFGNFAYVMPNLTPGATYTVRLHFAESYFTVAGQRYFNVAINGHTALSNFDIATAAGAVNKAIVEQFTAKADSGGNITITFTWQTNWPLVNAVEILH